jgi:hypothetical protein
VEQKKLTGYVATISKAIGVVDAKMLAKVEDTMRHVIFHSTLDWQDEETFMRGARDAYGIVRLMDRGPSPVITLDDEETARLLGVAISQVPALAREYAKMQERVAA